MNYEISGLNPEIPKASLTQCPKVFTFREVSLIELDENFIVNLRARAQKINKCLQVISVHRNVPQMTADGLSGRSVSPLNDHDADLRRQS